MSETSGWISDPSVLRITDPVVRTVVARLLDNLGVHKVTKKMTVARAVVKIGLASNETAERDRVLQATAKHMERITGVSHNEIHIRPVGGTNVIITYQART